MDLVLPVTSPAPRQQDSQLHPRERVQGSREASLAQHPTCKGTDWMPPEGHRRRSCRGSGLDSGGCVSVETGGPAAAGASRPRTGRHGAGRCGPVAKRRELATGSRVPSPWQLPGVEAELLRILKNIWGREEQEREPQAGPPGRGGLQHPVALLPLPPSFPSSPELSLLAFSPLSRSSATFPEPWLLRAEGDVYWPPSMHPAPSQVLYASELI